MNSVADCFHWTHFRLNYLTLDFEMQQVRMIRILPLMKQTAVPIAGLFAECCCFASLDCQSSKMCFEVCLLRTASIR